MALAETPTASKKRERCGNDVQESPILHVILIYPLPTYS